MNLNDPFTQLKLTSAICVFLAVVITCVRFVLRRHGLWIDDICALLSLLCLCTELGFVMVPIGPKNGFFLTYVFMITCYATIWISRLAILATIMRIGLERSRFRLLFIVAAVFIVLLSVLIGQTFWICEPQRHTPLAAILPICIPNKQMAILQLSSDVFADLTLFLTAIRLFLVIQDKSLRYRFIIIFSMCITITLAAVVRVTYIFTGYPLKAAIASVVEASVSLIVCSIPVVANLFYQTKGGVKATTTANSAPVFLAVKLGGTQRASGSIFNLMDRTPPASPHAHHPLTFIVRPPSPRSKTSPAGSRTSSFAKVDHNDSIEVDVQPENRKSRHLYAPSLSHASPAPSSNPLFGVDGEGGLAVSLPQTLASSRFGPDFDGANADRIIGKASPASHDTQLARAPSVYDDCSDHYHVVIEADSTELRDTEDSSSRRSPSP